MKINYGTFQKKPVTVFAIQFTGELSAAAVHGWCGMDDSVTEYVPRGHEHPMRYPTEYDRSNGNVYPEIAPEFMVIKTLEGNHRADIGDWIIRGVKGEFYPCKPDIFEATYDALDVYGESIQ